MPEIKIVNATTGEEVVREMTDEEAAELKASQAAYKAEQAAKKAEEEARLEKLAALGLTVDDLKALLG